MRGYVMVGTNDLKLSEEFYDKLLTDPPKVCRDHCKKGWGKTFNNDI